jgi:hypothetical protein
MASGSEIVDQMRQMPMEIFLVGGDIPRPKAAKSVMTFASCLSWPWSLFVVSRHVVRR